MERDPMEMALSTDIVLDNVLNHLKIIDLLSCRLTSKFWNKEASSVLRKRPTMIKNISDETNLLELEECMKKSSDFPFYGLKFDEPWTLNSVRGTKFFENFGKRFTRLCVNTHCTRRLDVMVPFISHLSRLTVLEMACPENQRKDLSLKLFNDGKTLNLSSLKTLRIFCPHVTEDVLGQFLIATSPSLQIECLDATFEVLRALTKAGKLGAVTFIKFHCVYGHWRHQSKVDQLLSTGSPSLTKLYFGAKGYLSFNGLKEILFSSQHALKELHLDLDFESMKSRLGDFWNNFPVLAKLTNLSLGVYTDDSLQYLFRGRHGHNFPALKEFKFVCLVDYGYRQLKENLWDGLFVVPSVSRIDLKGFACEDEMKRLAQVFPSAFDIQLDCVPYFIDSSSSETDLSGIWSVGAFKCLERLRIWNYKVQQPRKHLISMDSFLTGIPKEICEYLRKHKKLNLIDSPWNELSRGNRSILQLKNLKELIVCFKLEDGLKELPEDPPFMSMVSVWYGLEMMPNLRTTFTYEVPLLRSRDKERSKAVIEGALKHVRPFVTVEPFFY